MRKPTEEELERFHSYTSVVQLHRYNACSSLCIRGFSLFSDDAYHMVMWGAGDVDFSLRDILAYKLRIGGLDKINCGYDNQKYPFSHYSFLTASTLERWGKVNEEMRQLGFHQTEPVYNEKNKTTVVFSSIEIPKILKELKKGWPYEV